MQFRNYLQKTISLNGLSTNKFGSLTAGNINTDKLKNISLFSSASLEDLQNLDLAALLANSETVVPEGEEVSTEQQALADVVKALMEVEDVQTAADVDGDGEVSEEEAMSFLQNIMGQDGDETSLTYDDIDNAFKEMGINLEDAADKAIEEALNEAAAEEIEDKLEEKLENTSPVSSSGGSGSSGNVGSSSSYGGNSINSSTNKAETPEEIQAKIDEKNGEISDIESQAEQDIKAEEEAKEKAMKDAGISDKEYEEYQKKEQELEQNISKTEDAISEQDAKISDAESTISSNEGYISSIESQIEANKSAMSAIPADDENASSRKAEIESKISNLEAEKQKVVDENDKLQKDIDEAEKEKARLEEEKKGYETQKQELLSNTLNSSEGFGKGLSSTEADKLKSNIAEFDNNIAQIRAQKDQDVAKVRNEIQELQVKLKDAEQAEQRNKTLGENSAFEGQSLLDLAKTFDGKPQSEMREIMRAAGYQFDDGVWCADFVSFIAGQTIGEDNLPDWYKNCNRAYCPSIYGAAKENGATVSVAEAQPGDAILFDWDGDGTPNHIGYVESVNPDGSVNTIEGNTNGNVSGSQVARKVRYPKNIMTCVRLT